MTAHRRLCAVLWDFDGTLVDTRARNLQVNRRIIGRITGRPWAEFAVLRSQEDYDAAQRAATNWREFYRDNIGLDDARIDRAGERWAPSQLEDSTPVPLADGVAEALERLDGLPQGIVSQNARETIESMLSGYGLGHRFGCIIGYAEVAMTRQKPAPDCLLLGIEMLARSAPGRVLYIGDHPTDIRCAANANRELAGRGSELRVVSVAALWGPEAGDHGWAVGADYRATTPNGVVELVHRLAVDQG
jgi:phosphoglycolate phosphatase-like HAD superfamily hydrolase